MGSLTPDDDPEHLHLRVPNVPAIVMLRVNEQIRRTQEAVSLLGKEATARAERSTLPERILALSAVAAVVVLLACSLALSFRPPTSIVDAPMAEVDEDVLDLSWHGFGSYALRLAPLGRHMQQPSMPFQPIARGPHGFVQFSAYRLSARLFAVVGFGAHYLKDHLGDVRCTWLEGGNETVMGTSKIIYAGLDRGSDYDAILIRCEFEVATGATGGDLFLTVAGEEFRAYRELLAQHHPIDPPKEDALPHLLCACAVRMANPLQPRAVFEWMAFHWHLGISSFRVYDTGSVDQRLGEVLEDWLANGTALLVPTRHLAPFRMEFDTHALSALDCLYSSHFSARWVTVLSPDSYLFISPPASLVDYLTNNADRSWITFGSQEWSPHKCREGLRLDSPAVWRGKRGSERGSSAYTVEWLVFRRKEIECGEAQVDKQTCIGEAGQRSHLSNPRKAGILGFFDVRETDSSGKHAVFDEIHKNRYPSLHELAVYNATCSEIIGDDEFAEGWVRDATFADYVKTVRKSPQPTGALMALLATTT